VEDPLVGSVVLTIESEGVTVPSSVAFDDAKVGTLVLISFVSGV